MSERKSPAAKDAANYSQPSAGVVNEHKEKGAYDVKHGDGGNSRSGNSGVTVHEEKADGKNRTEPVSRPGQGGNNPHPEKADGKNRTEPVSAPSHGVVDEHKNKKLVEPQPKGEYYQQPGLKSTKTSHEGERK